MKNNFYVYTDLGAGTIWMEQLNSKEEVIYNNSLHGHQVFQGTKEECVKYIDERIEESTMFLVFRDDDFNYYLKEWQLGMGSYDEQKACWHDTFEKDFSAKDEAEKYAYEQEIFWNN